jgi:hypothetical protein
MSGGQLFVPLGDTEMVKMTNGKTRGVQRTILFSRIVVEAALALVECGNPVAIAASNYNTLDGAYKFELLPDSHTPSKPEKPSAKTAIKASADRAKSKSTPQGALLESAMASGDKAQLKAARKLMRGAFEHV